LAEVFDQSPEGVCRVIGIEPAGVHLQNPSEWWLGAGIMTLSAPAAIPATRTGGESRRCRDDPRRRSRAFRHRRKFPAGHIRKRDMAASIIDGRALAEVHLSRIRAEVDERARAGHRPPDLAVVLVGDDPASAVYVRNKRSAAQRAGIHAHDY